MGFEKRVSDHVFTDASNKPWCRICGEDKRSHLWPDENAEPSGTFACPICGGVEMHEHSSVEVARFLAKHRFKAAE